jgi:hypothetical protein
MNTLIENLGVRLYIGPVETDDLTAAGMMAMPVVMISCTAASIVTFFH